MNLGEFIIKIGTQGDTKELEKTIQRLEAAEKKTRRMIKAQQDLAKATNDEEKALIRKNAAQQDELEGLKAAKSEHDALSASMQKNVMSTLKFIGGLKLALIVLDRMGNSLLKSNQMYMTFSKTTDISISRLNRIAGIAQMASTGLSPEQVAGDLQSLQEKIFGFERLGENAKTFGMLGINPRGMDSDQLILALRQAFKRRNYSGRAKSRMLSELGLSQEWINVLDLSDEKFNEYLKTSSKLQLDAKERNKLAKYTAKQQQNNMRWELAKQKLLIAIMPMVQDIMEAASKIALWVSNLLEKNPEWLNIVKDILIMFTGFKILRTIRAINKMVKGLKALGLLNLLGVGKGAAKVGGAAVGGGVLGGLFAKKGVRKALGKVLGKNAAKFMARQAIAGGATAATGGAGLPFAEIALAIWGLWEIGKDIFDLMEEQEDKEDDDLTPDPDEGAPRYQYSNYKSNMTNNFFNNPQPAKEAIQQLSNYHNLILAEQNR